MTEALKYLGYLIILGCLIGIYWADKDAQAPMGTHMAQGERR